MSRLPITFHRINDGDWFESNRGNYVAKWTGTNYRKWRLFRREGETLVQIGNGYNGFELLGRAALRDEALLEPSGKE